MSFPRFFSCFLSVICCSPNTKSGCLSYFRLWKKSIPRVLMSLQIVFRKNFAVETIEKANGWKSTVDNLTSVLAPVFGTFIYAGFGLNIVILLNAFSFLISFLFLTKNFLPGNHFGKKNETISIRRIAVYYKKSGIKNLVYRFYAFKFFSHAHRECFRARYLKDRLSFFRRSLWSNEHRSLSWRDPFEPRHQFASKT